MDSSLTPARIGLIGGECTGKSTLAHHLADRLPGTVVPEYLREFVATRERTPLQSEQAHIMRVQLAREEAAAEGAGGSVIVADPATLMTAVYSIAYFDDDALVDDAVALARAYRLLVWCDVDLPWVPDGVQRDGPQFRQREHAIITRLVAQRLEPAGIEVVLVQGTVDQRLEAALRAWHPEASEPPT